MTQTYNWGRQLDTEEPNDVDILASQLSANDWSDSGLHQADRDFDLISAEQILRRFHVYFKDSDDIGPVINHPK